MPCIFCLAIRQYLVNGFLALDLLLNAVLGGDPHETLSHRTARAELAGNRLAAVGCRVLGWFDPGHCDWSLTPGTIGKEVWSWTPSGRGQLVQETE